ncbi:unnamed protein product [Lymnaea stagnalis]|uniref:Uncharacterized protein n=1 Tax=Lymnaea stagnalis TaxID=6523 RepID=A0AAV2I3F8_LYMST
MRILFSVLHTMACTQAFVVFSFLNQKNTKTSPGDELRSFTLDLTGSRIVENVCKGTHGTGVIFRLDPKQQTMTVVEKDDDPNREAKVKSCLTTDAESSQCNYCGTDLCQWAVSIPCHTRAGTSRWDTTLEIDVALDQGNVTLCNVMCLDLGYFDEEKEGGGNGITYEVTGMIVGGMLVLLGLVPLIGVAIFVLLMKRR